MHRKKPCRVGCDINSTVLVLCHPFGDDHGRYLYPKISITRNDGYVLSIDPSLVMGFSENMVDIPLNHTQMIIFPKKNSHKSYTSHYGTSRMFEYVEPSHIKFGPLLRKKWHSQTPLLSLRIRPLVCEA